VDQDELVPEYGGVGEWDELSAGFGRREPVRQYPRGPKGYVRSDERIREDICDELMQMADIDSSDVEVAVREGEVVLRGTVPDRSMKYRIEQIADRCAGVVEIENQIRVRRQQ
jgi:osmotically-inducible protein OsmY